MTKIQAQVSRKIIFNWDVDWCYTDFVNFFFNFRFFVLSCLYFGLVMKLNKYQIAQS